MRIMPPLRQPCAPPEWSLLPHRKSARHTVTRRWTCWTASRLRHRWRVIPSYALRLLEGCGSVKPGELKVIGKTQPVPFITVFVADNIPAEKEQKILKTLLGIKGDAKLLKAMESRDGFKPVKDPKPGGPQASGAGLAGLARAGSRWACATTSGATAGDSEVRLEKGRHDWRPCRFKRQR